MNSNTSRYLAVLGGIALLYLLLIRLDTVQKRSSNFNPSFLPEDKIPYGTFILRSQIQDIFPESPIYEIEEDVYTQLNPGEFHEDIYEEDYSYNEYTPDSIDVYVDDSVLEMDEEGYEMPESTLTEDSLLTMYLFINDYLEFDEESAHSLLEFVQEGNFAFLAAESFPESLSDSLGFRVSVDFFSLPGEDSTVAEYTGFLNQNLVDHTEYEYGEYNTLTHFSKVDTLTTVSLARNAKGNLNLIRIDYGLGAFYLCSSPYFLTNFHLVHNLNHDYVSTALSHIPTGVDIWWDTYYTSGSRLKRDRQRRPLMYVLSQEALRWAFWILVLSGLVYVLVEFKRKQRIIPILKAPTNTSLEFTRTIGRLYFQRGDNLNLVQKKVTIFLEYIRRNYQLKTQYLNEEFIQKLSSRTGINALELIALFQKIETAQRAVSIDEKGLQDLCNSIDDFYRRTLS